MSLPGRGDELSRAPVAPESAVLRSRVALGAIALFVVAVVLATYSGSVASASHRDAFLCETARAWRSKYPPADDLQIVVSDVMFHGNPGHFVAGDGVVVAPIALGLPGVQDVLEVTAIPPPSRNLTVDGIRAVAWDYAGALHRDMRYTAVALVRRPRVRPAVLPEAPTFETLDQPWRFDARLTAAQLETEPHALQECRAFEPWVRSVAGEPPYTRQLLRLTRRLNEVRRDSHAKGPEDVCAAIRANAFTEHQAQVAVVMGVRELGGPAIALMSADPDHAYWVATYVDGPGWVALDVDHPELGYQTGGPAVMTTAPLAAPFEASQHGFWQVTGQAYMPSFGALRARSTTRWVWNPSETEDETVPRAMPLEAVCP